MKEEKEENSARNARSADKINPPDQLAVSDLELLGPPPNDAVPPPDSITMADIQTTGADLDDFQEEEVGETVIQVVHKPDRDKKFWACPDPAYRGNFYVLEAESESGLGKTRYLVTKRGRSFVPSEQLSLGFLILCKYHGEGGEYFILKAGVVTNDADPNVWTKSAHACIKQAMSGPIRMYSKRDRPGGRIKQGYFRSIVKEEHRQNYSSPEWPNPEQQPFIEFLKIAFEGKIIDGPNHPILSQFSDERPLGE